jgi:hypothetical protein
MKMTEQERKVKAAQIFTDMEQLVLYLYSRWQDEQEYEDFTDYSDTLKNKVTELGGTFIKAKKKPFSFIYTLANVLYEIRCSNKSYSYKRIA